jgi:manganese oxidase
LETVKCLVAAGCLTLLAVTGAQAGPKDIQPNDNRLPSGRLAGGVLTLRLEIREGVWNPEGENGPQIPVQAFGEEGRPSQNPGPLIRVPVGTRVRVAVRNLLASTSAAIHGLNAHSAGGAAPITVEPGQVREVEFQASRAGVYFYWGTTTGVSFDKRNGVDSQLSGALVVDPPAVRSVSDRVFVLGHWSQEGDPKSNPPKPDLESWVINGKAWPHTERLTYPAGRPVRWNWVNATDENHPLHLHGHYFVVEGTGDEKHWTPLAAGSRRRAATEAVTSGSSIVLSWVPERPGNWLFHCHVLFHVAPELRQAPDVPGAHHEEHDASRHMAGLVLGIAITQPNAAIAAPALPVRRLRLAVGQREGVDLHGKPGLGYRLAEAGSPGTDGAGAFSAPGPPIVLTRGEPVEITIENRLPQSTSVHWHGIELESYYDGVPGWGGEGKHITPPIGPGETFVARFTPPRAGTFMYHTHLNDYVQLSTGLYGPLIVIEPGRRFDPESDKIFVLSRGGPDDEKDPFLINGSATPPAMELLAGKTYRFRFIGITPAPNLVVALDGEGQPQVWRRIAKDGASLPPSQTVLKPATVEIYPGETYDFEFRPVRTGALRLTATQSFFKLQTAVPIIVRGP